MARAIVLVMSANYSVNPIYTVLLYVMPTGADFMTHPNEPLRFFFLIFHEVIKPVGKLKFMTLIIGRDVYNENELD